VKVKLSEAIHPNHVPNPNRISENNAGIFNKVLKETVSEQQRLICENLFDQIEQLSQELKKSLTPEGVRRYTRAVTAFMKEAIRQSYELGEESCWNRSGNRSSFVIVRKINQSLEEMMELVLNKEKNQLAILAKIDEIRGLLLDLYF